MLDATHRPLLNGLDLLEDSKRNKHVLSTGCQGYFWCKHVLFSNVSWLMLSLVFINGVVMSLKWGVYFFMKLSTVLTCVIQDWCIAWRWITPWTINWTCWTIFIRKNTGKNYDYVCYKTIYFHPFLFCKPRCFSLAIVLLNIFLFMLIRV